jgi:hypothetical protein
MGRDFEVFPETNNKAGIENIFLKLGCEKISPNLYYWFERKEYKSIDGVKIEIILKNKETVRFFSKKLEIYNICLFENTSPCRVL